MQNPPSRNTPKRYCKTLRLRDDAALIAAGSPLHLPYALPVLNLRFNG